MLNSCQPALPDPVAKAYASLPNKIDYNFHVKPILSDRCYQCHGPDENTREANLRLDLQEEAFARLNSGKRAFAKGSLRKSEAFHRIISEDPEMQMPPPDSKLSLSPREMAIISKWLKQGAEWKTHWSFLEVEKPEVPRKHEEWMAINPIDQFIQAPLPALNLSPNPVADKERLLRRVAMDLTGLPPTIEEIDNFLADTSPEAYEKVVDRLLASVAHAERLTMEWLDVARYADSHGVSFDGYRRMWPYRDWVIGAFQQNMPFDRFITRQVAGDLLPNATDDEQLATAFYRHNPMEASMGSIEEEYRVEYVAERTATTGTAFLGLTIGCARCHDHKFDPISQKEFYQLSAFFNSVEELGLGPTDLNRAPTLLLYEDPQKATIDSLERLITLEESRLDSTKSTVDQIGDYIAGLGQPQAIKGEIGYFPFEQLKKIKRKKKQRKKDKEEKKKPEYEEVLILDGNKKSEATLGVTLAEGKKGKGLLFDEDYDYASLKKLKIFDHYDPFSVSAWINPKRQKEAHVQTVIGNSFLYVSFFRGWDLALDSTNHLRVRLIHRLPDDYVEVVTREAVPPEQWTQVGFTYDGGRKAKGIALFINGRKVATTTLEDRLQRSIKPIHRYTARLDSIPLRIGKSYRLWSGDVGLFRGVIDEVRLFDRQLSMLEMAQLGENQSDTAPDSWKREYASLHDQSAQQVQDRLLVLRQARAAVIDTVSEVMVMKDRDRPRKTFLLERGLYNAHGEEVECGTPAYVLPFTPDFPKNRLGLAQWLVHRKNPLTARVTINRYWQMIFGVGIVKTTEDFGNQGELPSHPELLDWLAAEFMDSGWDLRKMLKMMVMSYTYRQSSRTDPEQYEKDPENRYYARGNSYRWPAEIIRDNALAASGLLKNKVGGPSVKPYQPDGLWRELGQFTFKLAKYQQDSGADLYRRSLYTFIRGFSPHPFLTNFDATNREICITRRSTTNTPLQALNLLNDPQFVEASRVLSERVQREAAPKLEEQIRLGFRLSTGVKPTPQLLSTLTEQYHGAYSYFTEYPNLADSLLHIGEKPPDPELDKTRTAALTMVANTIFNYDESYIKR